MPKRVDNGGCKTDKYSFRSTYHTVRHKICSAINVLIAVSIYVELFLAWFMLRSELLLCLKFDEVRLG